MNEEFKNLTAIENYVNGTLSVDEKNAFEKRLAADTNLAQELQLYKNILGGIDLEGTSIIRNELKDIRANLEKEQAFETTDKQSKVITMKPKKNNSSRNWLAIAASLLVLVAVGFWLQKDPSLTRTEALARYDHQSMQSELLTNQINEYEGLGMADPERGKKDTLATVLQAYKAGDYQASYNLVTTYLERYPTDEIAQYYAGMTQFQEGQYTKAVEWLTKVAINKDLPVYDQARWYLGLTYMMLNTPEGDKNAKKLFQQIKATPDSKFKNEADWQLEFLNSN